MKKTGLTLGCMDSGVGGLAVLNRFSNALPKSPTVFLGDTAWMPYGEKPLNVVRDRVLDVFQWLHNNYPLAAFVLACNTATVAAFDALEAMNLPYPLLEPVKTTSMWVNANIDANKRIGILATPGTVSGKRYLRFLDDSHEVLQIPCTGLASIIETGVCSGPELDAILLPYLDQLKEWNADVMILGCTHYSLIQDYIRQIVGPHVTLVDSADILARMAIPIIEQLDLGNGNQQMLVTGNAQRFSEAIINLPLDALHGKSVTEVTIGEKVPLA